MQLTASSGLGCGIIQSTIFIAVQAAINQKDKATGISGFFLATQIGIVLGMAAVSALMLAGVQQTLRPRLIAEGVSMLKIDKVYIFLPNFTFCQLLIDSCAADHRTSRHGRQLLGSSSPVHLQGHCCLIHQWIKIQSW